VGTFEGGMEFDKAQDIELQKLIRINEFYLQAIDMLVDKGVGFALSQGPYGYQLQVGIASFYPPPSEFLVGSGDLKDSRE